MAYKFDPVRWLRGHTTSSDTAGWLHDQWSAIVDWFGPGARTIRGYLNIGDIGKTAGLAMGLLLALQGAIVSLPWLTIPAGLTSGLATAIAACAFVVDLARRFNQGPAVHLSTSFGVDDKRTLTITPPISHDVVVTQPTGQPTPAGPPVIVPPAPDQPAILIPSAESAQETT